MSFQKMTNISNIMYKTIEHHIKQCKHNVKPMYKSYINQYKAMGRQGDTGTDVTRKGRQVSHEEKDIDETVKCEKHKKQTAGECLINCVSTHREAVSDLRVHTGPYGPIWAHRRR